MTEEQVKLNQTALNAILIGKIVPLNVDGDFGALTLAAENLFLALMGKVYKGKGYISAIEGLHAIRMDDTYTNTFSDWFFCFENYKQIKFFPASTKPGTVAVWKKAFEWIMGKQGVAVLKEAQILNFWSIQSAYWSGLRFLLQVIACVIFRDNNTDGVILRTVEHYGLFGINGHSWTGWRALVVSYWKDAIRKIGVALSEGCQVTVEQYWVIIIEIIIRNNRDNRVDFTLTHFNDFKEIPSVPLA